MFCPAWWLKALVMFQKCWRVSAWMTREGHTHTLAPFKSNRQKSGYNQRAKGMTDGSGGLASVVQYSFCTCTALLRSQLCHALLSTLGCAPNIQQRLEAKHCLRPRLVKSLYKCFWLCVICYVTTIRLCNDSTSSYWQCCYTCSYILIKAYIEGKERRHK